MKCAFCDPCPTGFSGHGALSPLPNERQPGEGFAFTCLACGREWLRVYSGHGEFVWKRHFAKIDGVPEDGSR